MTDTAAFERIHSIALANAKSAIACMGPENTMALNCGFAWVELRPGNHPFARWIKAQNIGEKGWNGGVHIWNVGGFNGQQVDHKVAGAEAYANTVRELVRFGGSFSVAVGSRLD